MTKIMITMTFNVNQFLNDDDDDIQTLEKFSIGIANDYLLSNLMLPLIHTYLNTFRIILINSLCYSP